MEFRYVIKDGDGRVFDTFGDPQTLVAVSFDFLRKNGYVSMADGNLEIASKHNLFT